MRLCVFEVPYDSGRRSVGMGRGPERLVEAGVLDLLKGDGHAVSHLRIEHDPGDPSNEIGATFALNRRLAAGVRDATRRGELPVVLSGNCNSAHGTLAGLGSDRVAVVWLDAHGDFNTPDTTESGFFDGMALAALVGRCWTGLERSLGLPRVREQRVILGGARDLDDAERRALEQSAVLRVDVRRGRLAPQIGKALSALDDADGVYLHVDVDVLDPSAGPANAYATPGGVGADDLVDVVTTLRRRLQLRAVAFTAYDPGYDPQGLALAATLRAIRAAVADA